MNQGAHNAATSPAAPSQARQSWRTRARQRGDASATIPSVNGRKSAATNFVMKPRTKNSDAPRMLSSAAPLIVQRRPPEEVKYARAVAEDQRRLHVVRPQAVGEQERRVDEQQQHRDGAAHRPGQQRADRKHVGEREASGQRVR